MAEKNSPSASVPKLSQSKSTKGSPVSSDSSLSKSFKILDRKPSTKSASSPERRIVRVSDMQKHLIQLQEELKKEKEEKARLVEELMEVRKSLSSQNKANEGLTQTKSKVEALSKEVEKAKESERQMLESLVSQTKQLEQTKIALEEANLEIKSLQESIKRLEGSAVSASRSSRNLGKYLERPGAFHAVQAEEEIRMLKIELKLATEAEENSKKAMDDLAIALKEVTMEANQLKESFSISQSELESIRKEAGQSKASLRIMEEKFRIMEEKYQLASEESERLKMEAEESMAAWNEKENGFVDCIKISEEEISEVKQENSRLLESQRDAREENSKLRDLLKQAVSEATVVKEALEIARNENSQLKDLLSEKENALQSIRQDYDSLKVSEGAALDSVKELKSLLAATSTVESKCPSSVETGSFGQPKTLVTDVGGKKGENSRKQNGRRHSIGEPVKFSGSMFDMAGSPEQKDRMFASLSNVNEMRAASSIVMDDGDTINSDDFDYIDRSQLDGMEHLPTKQKKKKPILRRFGDLLKRKSVNK